jgi:outer membrane protein TolC
MGAENGLYALSAFAEGHSETFAGRFAADTGLLDEEQEGWFVDLAVELPVFKGLERKGLYQRQRARLEAARHDLRRQVDSIERAVRKAYQTVLERRQEVDILRETVSISKERLRVQERLKELGEISDNELETFRTRYFADQDDFFGRQISLIEAQEDLRRAMSYFEPLPPAEENEVNVP